MIRKTGTLTILLFVLGQVSYGQTTGQPRQIKVKGIYVHSPTMTEFPENIGSYQRRGVYAFDKKKENIGSTYESEQTTFSVYIYPAGEGTEGRLRNQYLQEMQDIADASKSGLHAQQGYTYFKKDGYRINGFSAVTANAPKSKLTIFECGQWFFKIRITTNSLDTAQMKVLEKDVLELFKPTDLVKRSRLDSKASVYFSPASGRDSLLLGSVMGSAFKKISWALDNVDSLERAAGFPTCIWDFMWSHLRNLRNLKNERIGTGNKVQVTT